MGSDVSESLAMMRRQMNRRRVEASAPGKINLVLRVLDRRSDGYHNLVSVMQAVELADTISVEEVPALTKSVSRAKALSCRSGRRTSFIGPRNPSRSG